MKIVGEKIRQARRAQSWTQKELADQADCWPGDISDWENGKVSPSLPSLDKLALALEKPSSYFLEQNNAPGHSSEGFRGNEEKYSNKGVAQDPRNEVIFLRSEIKILEGKMDDKEKIIRLLEKDNSKLEAENQSLKKQNAELQGRLKDGTTSK